jgi:hypothetical protein
VRCRSSRVLILPLLLALPIDLRVVLSLLHTPVASQLASKACCAASKASKASKARHAPHASRRAVNRSHLLTSNACRQIVKHVSGKQSMSAASQQHYKSRRVCIQPTSACIADTRVFDLQLLQASDCFADIRVLTCSFCTRVLTCS